MVYEYRYDAWGYIEVGATEPAPSRVVRQLSRAAWGVHPHRVQLGWLGFGIDPHI